MFIARVQSILYPKRQENYKPAKSTALNTYVKDVLQQLA